MPVLLSLPSPATSEPATKPSSYIMNPWSNCPDLYRGATNTSESSSAVAIVNHPMQEGVWYYEPSYYNSFYFLYNPSTDEILSRSHHGQVLPKNARVCLDIIRKNIPENIWLHCVGIVRPDSKDPESFSVGVVDALDFVNTYEDRRTMLEERMTQLGIRIPPSDKFTFLVPRFSDRVKMNLWFALQEINYTTGEIIYEGIIAKKADSKYEQQMDDFKHTTPFWHNHRFAQ